MRLTSRGRLVTLVTVEIPERTLETSWLVFVFWFVVWQIVKRNRAPALSRLFLLGVLVGFSAMGIATVLIGLILAGGTMWALLKLFASEHSKPLTAAANIVADMSHWT